GSAQVYGYSSADVMHVVRGSDLAIPPSGTSITLVGSSIAVLIVPGARPGDINGDGQVNANDVPLFVSVLLGMDTDASHRARSDLNDDGVVDGADISLFVSLLTT